MQNLDITFDDLFHNSIWGKKPKQMPLPTDFVIFNEQHLVDAMKMYASNQELLKENNPLAEYVTGLNNQKTKAKIDDFAIKANEVSLDSYLQRVDFMSGGQDWSIAYFGLHGASQEIWDRTKQFIDKLSSMLNFRPGGRVDVDCFIGRYSSTPSGIHVDDAHNFGFTFRNGKTMYTWGEQHTDLLWLKSPDYDAFKYLSLPLENAIGTVCYFPHNALHVAETKENVSVNVNISLWYSSNYAEENIDFLLSKLRTQEILENSLTLSGPLKLQENDFENLEKIRKLILDGGLERQMILNQMLMYTTSGVKVPRPIDLMTEFNINNKKLVMKSLATLSWYVTLSNELIIGGNGHCISTNHTKDLVNLLEIIIGFKEIDVKNIKNDYCFELLNSLYRYGILEEI